MNDRSPARPVTDRSASDADAGAAKGSVRDSTGLETHLSDGVHRLSPREKGHETLWSAFTSTRTEACLYHTLAWRDFVERAFGHTPVYLMHVVGGRIRGVLPMFRISFPMLGSKYVSMPYDAGWGGALATGSSFRIELVRHAAAIATREKAKFLEIRPPERLPDADALGLRESQPVMMTQTHVEGEDVWSRIHKGQRRAVRRAAKQGVTVRYAESLDDYRRFFQIYLRVLRDFGTPPYGWHYFQTLFDTLHGERLARTLIVEHEGRCVAGMLVFCYGQTLVAKIAAALPGTDSLKVYPAMYGRCVDICIEDGFELLSWGTSSHAQQNLVAFKERWDGKTRPLWVYHATSSGRAPSLEAYYDQDGLARRIWRRLPVGLTRIPGGILNRWFC
jgi:serine/alanine adding enzyme